MKTAITGGAGFIGSHLVELLLECGDDVAILDDMSTGSVSNLLEVIDHPGLSTFRGSILDTDAVGELVDGADRVFHLAAVGEAKGVVEHPVERLRTSIRGTENVLDACTASGASLLLASTSEIHGKNTAGRLNEESDRVLGPALESRWSHAAAKGIEEVFAHAYWSEFGLRVAIVRLFNTVGPRQTRRIGKVVPNLVGQALRGEPLTVYGDGLQTRCFSYVGDVVPAMVKLAEEPRATGQAFNLGGAEETSIVDLARRVISETGSDSSIVYVPHEQVYAGGFEDMRRRVPDITKANALVGYTPSTELDEIIRRVASSLDPALAGMPAPVARS